MLALTLGEFWSEETLCFRREVAETGKSICLIEQIFNIMITVGEIEDLTGYSDGY